MFDSHCHLQFNAYNSDREAVIKRCLEKGVACNIVGTQKDTSKAAVEMAEKYDNFYATIGLHPIHTTSTEVDEEEIVFQSREENFDEAYYGELAKSKKVVAVGECGVELFHLPPDADRTDILRRQKESFLQQYNFARKHDLAMVIHVRDAYDEMIEILSVIARSPDVKSGQRSNLTNNGIASLPSEARNDKIIRGVMHCYSGNWAQAQKFLEKGLYLGFTGVITFPPRKTNPQPTLDLLEVVKNCPLDKMLIETDSPYLAPQAYRGKRCEPWMVSEVAAKIAEIKGLGKEEVVKATDENTKKLFRLVS